VSDSLLEKVRVEPWSLNGRVTYQKQNVDFWQKDANILLAIPEDATSYHDMLFHQHYEPLILSIDPKYTADLELYSPTPQQPV